MDYRRNRRLLGLAMAGLLTVSACGGSQSSAAASAAASTAAATASTAASAAATASSAVASTVASAAPATATPGTLSVGWTGFEMDSEDLTKAYWASIKKQFEAQNPGSTLNLQETGGIDTDLVNKLALEYRAGTAPDVVSIPTANLAQFAASNYLEPLDQQLAADNTFWPQFPDNNKSLTSINGKTYGVVNGDNVMGLFYNKKMFAQAGLPTTWQPSSWADILTAATAIKAKVPGVIPLWLVGGTPSGSFGTAYGAAVLLDGTSTPDMYDSATNKWIVDSPGLRAVFQYYKDLYSQGLGASVSDLLSPNATNIPPDYMAKGKLAIAFGVNFYPGSWAFDFATPWKDAPTDAGVAYIPMQNGGGQGVSALLGWTYSVSANSKHKDLAWNLIQLMMQTPNSVLHANNGGFVPPSTTAAQDPSFQNFAPPQGAMAAYVPTAKALPAQKDYPGYARALNEATGSIISNPSISVDSVIAAFTQTLSSQLGPDKIEVKQ